MKFFQTTALLGVLFTACTAHAELKMSLFEITAKPGFQTALEKVGRENLSTSVRTEKGTLAMYQAVKKSDPLANIIVEIYQDEAAYEVHRQAPHFLKFVEVAKTAVADRKAEALQPEILLEKPAALEVSGENRLSVRLASVSVKPEFNAQFKAVVASEMRQAMAKEPGVLVLYAATLKENPNEWRFFEIYQDEQAYLQHRETAHFKQYLAETEHMVSGKNLLELKGMNLMSKGQLGSE